jgi:cobalt/nickel transport protein
MRRFAAAILLLIGCSTTSSAHYNMLFPDKPWANKDEKVTLTYQFGHPFEHELFDAPKPVSVVVLRPKAPFQEALDFDKALTKIELPGADGRKVTAWRFSYTPSERGDHVFVLKTAPIKHDEAGHFIEDVVKVVLHVQTQNGWDRFEKGNPIDIVPYTRPYGLLPGMAFKGRAGSFPYMKNDGRTRDAHPDAGLRIEIEKYNAKPMKDLPPDELITFQTKTDFDGFFVTTLPDAGWWGVTALAQPEKVGQGKDARTITRRATLWLRVDEKK